MVLCLDFQEMCAEAHTQGLVQAQQVPNTSTLDSETFGLVSLVYSEFPCWQVLLRERNLALSSQKKVLKSVPKCGTHVPAILPELKEFSSEGNEAGALTSYQGNMSAPWSDLEVAEYSCGCVLLRAIELWVASLLGEGGRKSWL